MYRSRRCGYAYNTVSPRLTRVLTIRTFALAFRTRTIAQELAINRTSEAVLGKAFLAIAEEFPRSSYQIITKAGRYGRTRETGFDYSPARIRSSIANSLNLLKTTYLDGVYMHDVEFVATQIGGAGEEGFTVDEAGNLREEDMERWGLTQGREGEIRSEGDQKVLDAMKTLFEMKAEGIIHAVGFSGLFYVYSAVLPQRAE